MKLFELRSSALQQAKKAFPKMPDYVVQDLVYAAMKEDPSVLNDEGWVRDFKDLNWKNDVLNITLDIFDERSQKQLQSRMGGEKPKFVKNDAKRHETQQQMVKSNPSSEPIIVLETPGGYELVEGWHRTIQSLLNWPKGYKQIAWIGYK